MKESLLYEKLPEDRVRCSTCPHRCVIAPGARGLCRVRENQRGILFALNYGKTIALAVDPVEKKPLYHFLPHTKTYSFATQGCNLRCAWCQNWEIAQSPSFQAPVEGRLISPEEHVKNALALHCPSISFTYSEPTIFLEYALDTMIRAKEAGLKTIWVTNGYMTPETLELLLPYLDAANVDYKGADNQVYQKYCGGTSAPVRETLRRMVAAGVHVEVTTLVIPGVNDSPESLDTIARFIAKELGPSVPWHVSRFFPAWKMLHTPVTPKETLDLAEEIGKAAGLLRIHLGNL